MAARSPVAKVLSNAKVPCSPPQVKLPLSLGLEACEVDCLHIVRQLNVSVWVVVVDCSALINFYEALPHFLLSPSRSLGPWSDPKCKVWPSPTVIKLTSALALGHFAVSVVQDTSVLSLCWTSSASKRSSEVRSGAIRSGSVSQPCPETATWLLASVCECLMHRHIGAMPALMPPPHRSPVCFGSHTSRSGQLTPVEPRTIAYSISGKSTSGSKQPVSTTTCLMRPRQAMSVRSFCI